MKLPCREKYLDEAYPTWLGWPNGDGTWDIVHEDNITHTVFKAVPESQAQDIIALQNSFKTNLIAICTKGLK